MKRAPGTDSARLFHRTRSGDRRTGGVERRRERRPVRQPPCVQAVQRPSRPLLEHRRALATRACYAHVLHDSTCRDVLEEGTAEEEVLMNALRVLLLLGDERIRPLAEPLQERRTLLGTLARLIPVRVTKKRSSPWES
jgi:hypothetical protein